MLDRTVPLALNNGIAASFHDNSAHGEDSFFIRELSSIACLDAVLDGVTHCEGAYASNFAAETLRDSQIASYGDLINALEQANSTLFEGGMGQKLLTTVSISLKLGDELHIVNSGDSPVYLIRDQEVRELSTIVKTGLLLSHVSEALGLHREFSYSSTKVKLCHRDRLILTTDGITNNFFPYELADIVRGSVSPQEAVSALHEQVTEKRRLHKGREDSYGTFREDDQTLIVRYFD